MLNQKKQIGFTLLEVLVALLVLSIGLLGVAGLQATSLQFNLDASSRSQVTILAEDILSKMRMRTNVLQSEDISAVIAQYKLSPTDTAGACVHNDASITNDLNCWLTDISTLLPNGSASITTSGGRDVTVTIQWFEQGVKSYVNDTPQASGVAGDALREGIRFFTLPASL